MILKLNREHQITVLISSNILDELSRLATHYGFIDGGRVMKEVVAKELDSVCRKCMRVEMSDNGALVRVFEDKGIEYAIASAYEADVFGQWNVTEVMLLLSKKP